jgi:hypothetical protein
MPIQRCGMKRKGLKIGGGLPGKTMVNPKEWWHRLLFLFLWRF